MFALLEHLIARMYAQKITVAVALLALGANALPAIGKKSTSSQPCSCCVHTDSDTRILTRGLADEAWTNALKERSTSDEAWTNALKEKRSSADEAWTNALKE